ncbi:MAG: glutathione S-transferase family protein [Zetaproteobacteria bacterium]|nr:MAG: glutathione S-transferase family protein [Zetaproteobacteria bacterium]
MGMMIKGRWVKESDIPRDEEGRFVRAESAFRRWIGEEAFPPEPGRYHLYVSLACPWAHRTLIMRKLKGLEAIVPVHEVAPVLDDEGWALPEPDPRYGFTRLHQFYAKADSRYTGRVSVPMLWDAKRETIVNNESSEIVRMFNSAFDRLTGNGEDFYPAELREEIDEVNAFVYEHVNNGVYRCGFAATQRAYEEAFDALFSALDELEQRLEGAEFLVGGRLTEADVRLYPTLVRFDAVYYTLFKCNRNHIYEMPNLWRYLKRLYAIDAFRSTTDLHTIKTHYFASLRALNPSGIVPKGPRLPL